MDILFNKSLTWNGQNVINDKFAVNIFIFKWEIVHLQANIMQIPAVASNSVHFRDISKI